MSIPSFILIFLAAAIGSAVNSVAGGGTLVTFPAIVCLGLSPLVANATSTVALWPGLFGGLFGYRREMNDTSLILMRLGATSLIGHIGGRKGARQLWVIVPKALSLRHQSHMQ